MLSFSAHAKTGDDGCRTKNKKAIKLFQEGMAYYKLKNYKNSKPLLLDAIQKDGKFVRARNLLAIIYREEYDYKNSLAQFKKVIEYCPDFSDGIYFKMGLVSFELGEYEGSIQFFEEYISRESTKESHLLDRAKAYIEKAGFLKNMYNNPVPFNPVSLKNLSTASDEYLPVISPDNELAFFTRRYVKNDRNSPYPRLVEEFSYSKWQNGFYNEGNAMEYPFNSGNNEGGATVTIDNKILFFTACKRSNSFGSCDIYYSEFNGIKWGSIENVGPVINSKEWDSQPSVTSDGMVLFFSSNREGGYGGSDIYRSKKDSLGKWGEIVNMGPLINTAGNEKSPFIHQDSETLYFSSDGLQGMGGLDIFFTRKQENDKWTKPINLGHPINSYEDDIGFFVSTDGKTGYFASNKYEGKGGWDIYSFGLYEEARPQKVLFLKGNLKDEKGQPMENAKIEMINTITNEKFEIPIDSTGKYVMCIKFKNDMVMKVKQEDKLPITHYIALEDTSFEGPKTIDLDLKPIEIGEKFVVNNVYFETNSYSLSDKFRFEVEDIVEFLESHPRIRIDIQGHTDDVGDDEDNLILSENRARSVQEALVKKGINEKRLTHKGYGESKPISTNETAKGRKDNRRTEFVIIDK
ncbi:MAG: hypothetical protein COC01_08330 [Bacteroidetes bacterium]|nr:MAG: hypothetical protein COC01_08330 [Bacteroidota bacterium]